MAVVLPRLRREPRYAPWSKPAGPSRRRSRIDSHRRDWRRQLARLRQGHQLRADQRRLDARLPRTRQGRAADAAVDWRSRPRPAPAATRSRTRSSPTPRRTRRWPAATTRPRSGSRFSIRRSPCRSRAHVTAIAGYDALSHAVEAYVTQPADERVRALRARGLAPARGELRARAGRRRRTSRRAARCCWARTEAGIAIELSMLGATHACANPLTATIRHDARHRDRRHAAARRPLERRRPSATVTRSCSPCRDRHRR